MPAHPWLAESPWPTQQLPRAELEKRIDHFLATHWMGVLSTIGKDGPIGSPLEYHAEGRTVYILPQPRSPKLKALQRDPRLCLAIYAENSGWASVCGAQLFGRAEFLEPGTAGHDHAMTIYRWRASAEQLGRPMDQPPQLTLIKIEPERIVYTEQWLRKEGYAPRQIWHRDPNRQAATLRYGYEPVDQQGE
jgi:nitroimidazol reductase NimA-like FMN-containing flavoprotein (pyridoxamine 5'-phosphate oxidase superfamily)